MGIGKNFIVVNGQTLKKQSGHAVLGKFSGGRLILYLAKFYDKRSRRNVVVAFSPIKETQVSTDVVTFIKRIILT